MTLSRQKQRALSTNTDFQADGLETINFQIKADASYFLMERLTGLYENPLEATIREIISNAIDATRKVNGKRAISVTKPSIIDPFFTVRDYGIGMSLDDLKDVYTQYGASTKAEDNDQVGWFGLGAKAPLAYTEMFTVVTIKDGIKNTGFVTKSNQGFALKIAESEETDEQSGTTISIPIREDDTEQAHDILQKYQMLNKTIDGATLDIAGIKSKKDLIHLLDTTLSDGTVLKSYVGAEDVENVFKKIFNQNRSSIRSIIKENIEYDKNDSIFEDMDMNSLLEAAMLILQGFAYKIPKNTLLELRHYSKVLKYVYTELKPGYVEFNSSRDNILPKPSTADFITDLDKNLQSGSTVIHYENLTVGDILTIINIILNIFADNSDEQRVANAQAIAFFIENNADFRIFYNDLDTSGILGMYRFTSKHYFSNNTAGIMQLGIMPTIYDTSCFKKTKYDSLTNLKIVSKIENDVTLPTLSTKDLIRLDMLPERYDGDGNQVVNVVIYNSDNNRDILDLRKFLVDEVMENKSAITVEKMNVVNFKGDKSHAEDIFSIFNYANILYIDLNNLKQLKIKERANKKQTKNNTTKTNTKELYSLIIEQNDIFGNRIEKAEDNCEQIEYLTIDEIAKNYADYTIALATLDYSDYEITSRFMIKKKEDTHKSDDYITLNHALNRYNALPFEKGKPMLFVKTNKVSEMKQLIKAFPETKRFYHVERSVRYSMDERIKNSLVKDYGDRIILERSSAYHHVPQERILRKSLPTNVDEMAQALKGLHVTEALSSIIIYGDLLPFDKQNDNHIAIKAVSELQNTQSILSKQQSLLDCAKDYLQGAIDNQEREHYQSSYGNFLSDMRSHMTEEDVEVIDKQIDKESMRKFAMSVENEYKIAYRKALTLKTLEEYVEQKDGEYVLKSESLSDIAYLLK